MRRGAATIEEVLGLWNGELNEDSAHARDLLNWWPAAGASNAFARDYRSNVNAPFAGAVRLGACAAGRTIDIDPSTNSYFAQPASDLHYVNRPLTLVWYGVLDHLSSTHVFMGKHASSGGADNPFDFRTDGGSHLFLVKANATGNGGYFSFFEFLVGKDLVIGKPQLYVVTSGPNVDDQPQFYIDGIAVQSFKDFGLGTGATTGTNANLRLGLRDDNLGQMDGGLIDARIYGRVFSAQEVWDLWSNLYDLYAVPGGSAARAPSASVFTPAPAESTATAVTAAQALVATSPSAPATACEPTLALSSAAATGSATAGAAGHAALAGIATAEATAGPAILALTDGSADAAATTPPPMLALIPVPALATASAGAELVYTPPTADAEATAVLGALVQTAATPSGTASAAIGALALVPDPGSSAGSCAHSQGATSSAAAATLVAIDAARLAMVPGAAATVGTGTFGALAHVPASAPATFTAGFHEVELASIGPFRLRELARASVREEHRTWLREEDR